MKRFILVSVVTFLAICSSLMAASTGHADDAIRHANREFSANVHAANAQAIVDNYYATDAVGMAPNMPALHGREALRQFWTGFLTTGAIDLTLTSDNVTQRDDIAVEMGHYDLTITPKEGPAAKDKGKYVVMWKKSDGRWWAVEDIFNSDMPAAK